jgi:hypothetical protein
MQFPVVTSANLSRQGFTLPADFEGDVNVLLIAFQRWHQRAVDTWIPFVRQLEQAHDDVRYYELPVIQRMNVLGRTFINEGMRAGISDPVARARTITLYVDKPAFRQALELPHEEDIYVLLVDREGNVPWRAEGAFTPEKGESLAAALQGER